MKRSKETAKLANNGETRIVILDFTQIRALAKDRTIQLNDCTSIHNCCRKFCQFKTTDRVNGITMALNMYFGTCVPNSPHYFACRRS